ncbi:MAG: ATP-dependent DNA helicase RecG [Myxococcales bacterium]|nr:ATP-dependent DNA helicase RecG [Myxococcales bacterium]
MSPQELPARLRECLSASPPQADERAAMAEQLRALAGADAQLHSAAVALEGARDGRSLKLAAAKAMRLLAARPEPEPDDQDDDDAASGQGRARARAERRSARRAFQQEKALREDREQGERAAGERPIETLPGIGRVGGQALRDKGLRKVSDLAWLLPLGYRDERELTPFAELTEGARVLTEGRVRSARAFGGGRGPRRAEVILESLDGAGELLRLSWFRAPGGLVARFSEGAVFRVAGVVEVFRGTVSISHPETERVSEEGAARSAGLRPYYPVVAGVAPRTLSKAVAAAVERCAPALPDAVPAYLRERHGLSPIGQALRALHAPAPELEQAEVEALCAGRSRHHERLAFEEFFLLELSLQRRRVEEQGVAAEALHGSEAAMERARSALGFELTQAQRRVVAEIAADLALDQPMRRLLQGDVGSGKTAVALLAAAQAIAAGAQVAFMAPTELLAEQHFRTLSPLAQAMGLRAALVLGSERAAHRRKTRKALAEGTVDLAVGTHALLSEGVEFQRLRLVIVDEQHRFGVGQRLRLVGKAGASLAPHLLVMTATPIPRTLTLALHGDLESSVLDELPPGRLPPLTRAYPTAERARALRQLERALEGGGQAYVVCPTIEPDPERGLRSAEETFGELAEQFEAHGVALLHGRLADAERDRVMADFVAGRVRVLVGTTIVEVGIDVPRANVILIEHAERFGLAQLHQLRGRVGRGGQRSACLLVHEAASEDARRRIEVLCSTGDGFAIAEEDLALRGPGELFGRRQSGLPGFRFGDLRRDGPLLTRARELARDLGDRDPELREPRHVEARRALDAMANSERALVKEEAG